MLTRWGLDFLETSWGQIPDENPLGLIFPSLIFVSAIFAFSFKNKPSDYFHLFCFLTPIIPMVVITMSKGYGESYALMCLLAFLMSYAISKLPIRAPIPGLSLQFFSQTNFIYFVTVLGLVIILLSISRGGLSYFNLRFDDVYTFRRGASDTRGALLNYALLNYIGILLPFGVALSLKMKKYSLLLLLVVINLILFGLTSNKSYVFVSLFTIMLYVCMGFPKPSLLIAAGLAIICLGLTATYQFDNTWDSLPTLFVRRFFFVPAYANFQYWDFFQFNQFAFWSDSKLSFGLVESPYGVSTPRVIANYYSRVNFYGRIDQFSNSNTGWLGSGYANAGYYGMFFYAIVSGFITKYGNSMGEVFDNRVAIATLGYFFFTIFFTSTDLPAALLSYGMFAFIAIMSVWDKTKQTQ